MAPLDLTSARRKVVPRSEDGLVSVSPLFASDDLPACVQSTATALRLLNWLGSRREWIDSILNVRGGVLFRGFAVDGPPEFAQIVQTLAGDPIDYKERSSPRHEVSRHIYTSTDYAPDQPIEIHNENSYANSWPLKIFFFCDRPALRGGETPIALTRKLLAKIDPEVIEQFTQKGILYSRNYGADVGMSWQTAFQTDDPKAVEAHCRDRGYDFKWKGENRLWTTKRKPALVRHPRTGQMLWFNHAVFFHVSSLPLNVQQAMRAQYADSDLPQHTFFGDGSAIPDEIISTIQSAYRAVTYKFEWQKNDVLLLDNMLCGHGRCPFEGERRILVGMGEPIQESQVQDDRALKSSAATGATTF
jgi:hypothetical protein